MNYNWNWAVLLESPYLGWLAGGALLTVQIALSAWCIAFGLGLLLGVCRTLPLRAARLAAAAYVEVFRNIPLLVQMFFWYFVLPEILPRAAGDWIKRDMPDPEFATAVLALGLYTASRVAEQVRSGIQAIRPGLPQAAYASGMRTAQVYRHVLLPIALRTVIPPVTSEFLTIFKNSSLALTIGVLELTAQSQQITEYTFQGFEAFTAATVLYVAIALVVTVAMHQVERRLRIPGVSGTGG